MDPMLIAETFASFPGAIFDTLSSLPPVVWGCLIFMPLLIVLLRTLDADT